MLSLSRFSENQLHGAVLAGNHSFALNSISPCCNDRQIIANQIVLLGYRHYCITANYTISQTSFSSSRGEGETLTTQTMA